MIKEQITQLISQKRARKETGVDQLLYFAFRNIAKLMRAFLILAMFRKAK